ncbi:MAG: carboxypeptidase-like regulatory domain-containing protein, partial [Muribaculaceae bacterium]|nr:carboxypeptidase-like regulatory domain-containing protein [Muribaculaceae bacterium]
MMAAIASAAIAADIKGVIIDHSTGDPMSDATVRLLAAGDSTFVKGAIANVDGRYTISGIRRGSYIVEASYLGYNKGYVDVKVGNSNVSADTLRMTDS